MAVLVLTMVSALFIAAALLFGVGSRMPLSEEASVNEGLNFAAYFIGALPIGFVLVFFGLG